MSITFIVPTYNQRDCLNRAVRSITEQIKDGCRIIISDHGSTDGTEDLITTLCEEFPYIERRYCPRAEIPDFSHNFKYCFGMAETEWTWTFGHDDLLLPGALETVLSVCHSGKADFFHVAEEGRTSHTNKAIPGSLLSLCNMLGWIDMTGFLTGNIIRTKYIKEAVNSPFWDFYAQSSFPQSLAFLEVLGHREAAFIDCRCVKVQDTAATLLNQNWSTQKISERYLNLIDGLESLRDRGIIPKTLSNPFFRYISFYIWDRFIGHMINDYYYGMKPANWDRWGFIERYSNFLDEKSKAILDGEIKMVKDAILDHYATIQKLKSDSDLVDAFSARHNMMRFPDNYLPDQDVEPESLIVRSGLIGVTH